MAKRETNSPYSESEYETSGIPLELHCMFTEDFNILGGLSFFAGPGFGYYKYQTDYSYKDDKTICVRY